MMSIPFGFSPDENNDMAAMFENMAAALRNSSSTSSVNWESARQAANESIRTAGDPSVTVDGIAAINQSSSLADLWLNDVTLFPSAGATCETMTRTEWVSKTFEAWKTIVEPVADGVSSAMSDLIPSELPAGQIEIPEELLSSLPVEMAEQIKSMLGSADFKQLANQVMSIAKSMGATMFGTQFGQALGSMATEVLSSTDIGFPLMSPARAALMPANVDSFINGLSIDAKEARLYLALREHALVRLFNAAPWVQSQLLSALGTYARGVHVNTSRIEEVMQDIDPSNPNSLNELLGGNLFEASQTPEQKHALDRLEVLLALIEGWATVIVSQAAANRLPSVGALDETLRRRRAAGGPAEKLFGGLVGLELRPRRIREAVKLWQHISETFGIDKRDNLWSHPDLLPGAYDLENPEEFVNETSYDLMTELSKAIEPPLQED
jgi:putative hydrolase